jgi:hypothetical protein
VKEMGKNKPARLGQQKKGELKWQGTSEGKQIEKQNKTKAHPAGSRTVIRVHINGWPQNREIGGCWITPALLQALFTFLHSEVTLSFFLSFFLSPKSGGRT